MNVRDFNAGDVGHATGIPFDAYQAWPGVSRSRLWTLYSRTPAHFRYEVDHPEEVATRAMLLGSATHAAILEPDTLEARFCHGGPVNERTGKPYGADSKAFAEWEAAQGKPALNDDEWAECLALRDAVAAHPTATMLVGAVTSEVSMQWRHGPTGLLLKGRPDGIAEAKGKIVLVDVKTTRSAAPQQFGRDAYQMGYLWQLAFYRLGVLATMQRDIEDVIILAAEKGAPHAVAVYRVEESALDLGEAQVTDALRQLRLCQRFNDWPGYAEGLEDLLLPGYAGNEWSPYCDGLEQTLVARAKRAGRQLPEAEAEADDDDGYLNF